MTHAIVRKPIDTWTERDWQAYERLTGEKVAGDREFAARVEGANVRWWQLEQRERALERADRGQDTEAPGRSWPIPVPRVGPR